MFTVYRHRRIDTNEIFYVGIGKVKTRPYSKHNRNPLWYNIVNKTDYIVEILYTDLTSDDAKELEMFLISEYGRRDLGTGPLVNMTNGGDGVTSPSIEARKKIGLKHKIYHINKDELYKLYITENRSRDEIAKIYGCCRWVITNELKKYNIKKPQELQNKFRSRNYRKPKNC
jgi:hypothetical protein